MNKFFFSTILFVCIFFIIINNFIGKNDNEYFNLIKEKLPDQIKIFLKKNIFVHKYSKELEYVISRNNSHLERFLKLQRVKSRILQDIKKSEKKIMFKYEKLRNDLISENILDKKTIKLISLKKQLPNVEFFYKPEGNYEVFNIKLYNVNTYAILEKKNSKNLLIYVQGHKGNPYNELSFLKIKEKFKKQNYDILSLSIPLCGYNEDQDDFDFPGLIKSKYKKNSCLENREVWKSFSDPNYPNKNSLSLYLSGNYYLIDNFIDKYDHIKMIGFSTGGWFTTIISALNTKINESYSYAGTIPYPFNIYRGNYTNWMQEKSKIFLNHTYWDFYFLSTLDKNGLLKRDHFQIYNNNDRYMNDPSVSILKYYYDYLSPNKKFNIVIYDYTGHDFNLKEFTELVLK